MAQVYGTERSELFWVPHNPAKKIWGFLKPTHRAEQLVVVGEKNQGIGSRALLQSNAIEGN